MSRKTRKEKIKISNRKQAVTPTAKTVSTKEVSSEDKSRRIFFFKDLTKSIVIIVSIISLEFVIYFVTINR